MFAVPFVVFLGENNRNYVESDIFVICNKDKLNGKGYNGASDWIIEVISSSIRKMDYYS